MQVPIYGNNAYQYERTYAERPTTKVVRKVRVHKRKKNNAQMRGMILLGMAIVLAFGLLFSNSQILEKRTQVSQLKKELDTVNAKIVAGQFEIERNMDLNKIEEEATVRLGMQRPTKAQTVYVNMGNCDYAESGNKVQPKRENVFSAIAHNVLEYFG